MLVDHRRKLICVAVPKTGSTSLHYALKSALDTPFESRRPSAEIYHLGLEDMARLIGEDRFPGYLSVAVVRNPYDRVVSLWHDFRNRRPHLRLLGFRGFVRDGLAALAGSDVHFLPQTEFLSDRAGQLAATKLYRFEDGLEAALGDICETLGVAVPPLPHARKSRRDPWPKYFAEAHLAREVQHVYARDFERLGYSRRTDG